MSENIKANPFEIVVDDGSQKISIKNTYGDEIGVFYFRPTDLGIIDRYNSMVKDFDRILEPLDAPKDAPESGEGENTSAEMAALTEAKERLYEALDKVLGGNASEAFFGKIHPFSPVNGSFYCEIALDNLGKYISAQFNAETAKFTKRVEKYTKKYNHK